jgi:hypothetical protein
VYLCTFVRYLLRQIVTHLTQNVVRSVAIVQEKKEIITKLRFILFSQAVVLVNIEMLINEKGIKIYI